MKISFLTCKGLRVEDANITQIKARACTINMIIDLFKGKNGMRLLIGRKNSHFFT